jgi:uncharacterized protein
MNMFGPFVMNFKTHGNYYTYDVNTNRIILLNEIMFEIIPMLGVLHKENIVHNLQSRYDKDEIETNLNKILLLQSRHNLFSVHRPKSRGYIIPLGKKDIQDYFHTTGVSSLCLEISQQCNLRCKYCVYSGNYPLERIHNSSYMSWSTARKAIDYYLNNSKQEEVRISFYGGEPLLRFSLIKKCIDYLRTDRFRNKKKDIFITTNGILFKESMLEYCVQNDIGLQISIDGPMEQHDKCRIDKKGKGSYKRVEEKLEYINKANARYYGSRISISCVITPSTNINELNNFFSKTPLFKNQTKKISFVNKRNTTFYDDPNIEYNKSQPNDFESMHESFKASLISGNAEGETFLRANFEDRLIFLHKRKIYPGPSDIVPLVGPCFPGARKLFVSVDGKFHVCEKINPSFSIGDVEEGINLDKVENMMREFGEIVNRSECLNCWAINLCNLCYANVADAGFMKVPEQNKECADTKNNVLENIKTYAYLVEKNPAIKARWDKIVPS